CDTTLTCSAGDLIDNGPVTICPGEFATAEATGISVPGGACFGELRMNFIPDTLFPGTSGGLYPGGFSIGVTNPYSFDDDVNGIMSGNGLDSLRGRYWVQYFVQTTEGICFGDSLEVFFLAPDDPACSGVDCSVFDTAPVDLTKSFDPVNGVQDRVQVKWFKDSPQVRYSDEDAAACDLKFWPKRNLDPVTGAPVGSAIVAAPGDTINIVDMKKFQGDGVTPREIFKWPVKFRKNSDSPNARRADANIRYEWQVRCACEHGAGPESPWSVVKIFNTPDFDPETGIFTPPPGADLSHLSDAKQIASNTHKGVNTALPALSAKGPHKAVPVKIKRAAKPAFVAKSFSNEVSIKLYPNPTNDVLNIQLDSEVTSVNVKDMSGRTVIQETGNGSFLQISTATLSDGMYMVELEINGQITRKPFVVKK
ncbi:MAG: T9SS type A sorting domain-containing protein, partial [Flavobacteriales bacterium]|nr:T9SS type A sorting domain-containing protein [Flavobacteriales bacterium]